jgi:hypothetical protein
MALVGLLIGGAVGVAHVASARWTVARLRPGAPLWALVWVLGGMLLRLSAAVGVLTVALLHSTVTGAVAFAGLLLGRWSALIWLHTRQRPRPTNVSQS